MRRKKPLGEWELRKHAVKRFRQRFLRGKFFRKRSRRMRDEEICKIMLRFLRRSILFAKERNADNPAEIFLYRSKNFGNIYFITREMVVLTVYPGKYVADKINKGIWEKA